jgi:thiamine-phosphate pyrophosphorylase
MWQQTLRIVDANLNRTSEGLRFLEEIARLVLNDARITEQLKNMRHRLLGGTDAFQQKLMQARDAVGDVGVDIEVSGEKKERDLSQLLVANARRAQESLRTLEELAKLHDMLPFLDSEQYKKARFELYNIEQELLSRLTARDKIGLICGLYVIIDTQMLGNRTHLEVADGVVRGGARVIQLRDKESSKKQLLPLAKQLGVFCRQHDVLFIMNDHLDLALETDADGLHLGQDDLPVAVARRFLPPGKILGCSVTSVEKAVAAQNDGADYLGAGSIYPTSTKEVTVVIGLEKLRLISEATSLPVVAIGGINKDNAAEVIAAGADSVAVISAILTAGSPEEATRQIVERLTGKSE